MIASPPPLQNLYLQSNAALLNPNPNTNNTQQNIASPTALPNTKVTRQTPLALDTDTAERVVKTTKKTSSFFHLLANEPSLGLFHVQEHIRKNAPKLGEVKKEMRKKATNIEEITYDLNYSLQTIQSLHDLTTFDDIKVKLDTCIELIHKINRGSQALESPTTPSKQASTPQILTPSSPTVSSTGSNVTNTNTNLNTTTITPPTTVTNSPSTNTNTTSTTVANSTESYIVEGVDVINTSSGSSGEEVTSKTETEEKEPTTTSLSVPTSPNIYEGPTTITTPPSANSGTKKSGKKNKTPSKQKSRAQRSLSNSFDLQPKQF
eukprot:TRINITY_DN4030_c0_g1_i1.p1 TRINITY_DN4030_c0_g1~~TRINITY_DN4030_c0_g1_i1.p1  ORF type:complete len:320 (+),score=95.47 TRINITY_DN4030_c0_g1_i1:748-1707(+)